MLNIKIPILIGKTTTISPNLEPMQTKQYINSLDTFTGMQAGPDQCIDIGVVGRVLRAQPGARERGAVLRERSLPTVNLLLLL